MFDISFADKISRAYTRSCKALCHELDIPQTAFDILMFLANHPEYKSARDIVEVRRIKANLVSINVDRLVQEGLLVRCEVAHDHMTDMSTQEEENNSTPVRRQSSLIIEEIKDMGGAGRFATWKSPANMAMAYAATDYAFGVAEGTIKGYDRAKMEEMLKKYAGEVKTSTYQSGADKAENFLLFVGESKIFGL